MISKLYYIIEKNMLILFRSRGFVVGIVLAPLIIMILMGSVFSSDDINSIKIGVVDNSPDEVSSSLLANIDKSIFGLVDFNTIDECSESIVKYDTHVCVLFDENFKLSGKKKNTLYMYADYSKISLVWQIVSATTSSLTNTSQQESMNLVDSLLEQINYYDNKIDENSDKISLIVSDVEEVELKLSNSSRKLDNLNFADDTTVLDNVLALSEEIDSFRDKVQYMSDEQDLSGETIDNFSGTISESKGNLAEFESKFKNMRGDMTREKNDCAELRSYTLQKYGQYNCDNYDLTDVEHESDRVQTLYIECKAVKSDMASNLQTISEPIQACYIISMTSEMADEKITYIDQQIIELDSMIETTVEMQGDLDESIANIGDIKTSMDETSSELKKMDARLDKTKENLVDIENDVNTLTTSRTSEINSLKDELLSDIRSAVYSINLNKNDLGSIVDTFDEFKTSVDYKNLSAEAVVTPLDVVVRPVVKKKSSFDYISPILLAIMIAFSAVLIGALISIHEKLSNSIKRNLICPTSDWLFIFGTYLTNLIVLFVEMGIFMLVLLYFGAYAATNVMSLIIALFVVGSAFILIGMIIASFFNTEQSTIFAALSFLILIIFFSEVFVPMEKISPGLKIISVYNPLNLAISVFRKVVLFGFDVSSASIPLVTLAIFSILCFVNIYVLNVANARK